MTSFIVNSGATRTTAQTLTLLETGVIGPGGMLAVAATVAAVSSVAGLLAAYHAGLPSGPAIILAAGTIYLASLAFGPSGSLAARYWPRAHLEA